MGEEKGDGSRRTDADFQRPGREEEDVDGRLSTLDVVAHGVDVADQAGVGLEECVLAFGVQRLASRGDAAPGFLRAADKEDARLPSLFGELQEG